jgi:hypothetical protein
MYFVESQPKFRRNMSPPSSGSKNNPRKKQHDADNNVKSHVPQKPPLNFNGLHGVISLKVALLFKYAFQINKSNTITYLVWRKYDRVLMRIVQDKVTHTII